MQIFENWNKKINVFFVVVVVVVVAVFYIFIVQSEIVNCFISKDKGILIPHDTISLR